MRLYEFEGKALFEKFKIPVPNGTVVNSADEAESVSREMDVPVVLKSQVLTGGRGKAGGIKLIDSPADVKSAAETLFDLKIKGFPVEKLLIEPKLDIQKELYIGVTIDRLNYKLVVIASGEGGVDIEEVADKTPDKIFKKKYDIDEELYSFDAIDLAKKIGIQSNLAKQAAGIIIGLFRLFKKYDAKLAEINPLVITDDGRLIAADSRISLDDDALFRHPEYHEMRDISEEEPTEVEASKYKLNYIRLNGNVGCMVNGAGLAMATMDIIKLHGGEPANFLDVGGIASPETVSKGFKIIMTDKNVRAVLINIFGGIVRCDRVARGIINALKTSDIDVPIVVRLEGTNAIEARNILAESPLKFEVAETLEEAAKTVVSAAESGVNQ